MQKSGLLWVCVALILSLFFCPFPTTIYAQSESREDSSSRTTGAANDVVSVSASITVQVANETLKLKEGTVRSAIVGLFNSGLGILKTSDSDQPISKTKITNQISNTTQSVEGTEATYAVIGVEISKAFKSVISSSNNTGSVTLELSSTCKPAGVKMTSCDNSLDIK